MQLSVVDAKDSWRWRRKLHGGANSSCLLLDGPEGVWENAGENEEMQFGKKLKAVEVCLGFWSDESCGVILVCSCRREAAEEDEEDNGLKRETEKRTPELSLSLSDESHTVVSKLREILIHSTSPNPIHEGSVSSFRLRLGFFNGKSNG